MSKVSTDAGAPSTRISNVPADIGQLYDEIILLDGKRNDKELTHEQRKTAAEKLYNYRVFLSRNSQRKNYSNARVGLWHKQFLLIRKEIHRLVKEQPHKKRVAIVAEVKKRWDFIPDSMFKRFSVTFCHGHHLAIPKKLEMGHLSKAQKQDLLKKASLLGCNISPDLIPNKLLADLGIIEWQASKRYSRMEKLEIKSELAVQNALKLCFETSQQLEAENHRIWIIKEPSLEILRRYHELTGSWNFPETLSGGVFYFRKKVQPKSDIKNFSPKDFDFEPQMVQYFETIYEAARRTSHVAKKYTGEISTLSSFDTTLSYLFARLKTDGHVGTPNIIRQELTKDIVKNLAGIIDYLAPSQSEIKQEAYLKLLKIQEKIAASPSGITHPVQTENSISAIIRRLQARLLDVYKKNPYNTEDASQLLAAISKAETSFDILRDRLSSAEKILSLDWLVFKDNAITPENIDKDKNAILAMLGLPVDNLKSLDARPFNTFAGKILEQIDKLPAIIENGIQSEVIAKAYKIYMLASFQKLHATVQQVLKQLAEKKEVSIAHLNEALGALQSITTPREIFKRQFDKRLDEPYNNYIQILTACIDKTAQLAADPEGQADAKEYIAETIDMLKNLKIEECFREIQL